METAVKLNFKMQQYQSAVLFNLISIMSFTCHFISLFFFVNSNKIWYEFIVMFFAFSPVTIFTGRSDILELLN